MLNMCPGYYFIHINLRMVLLAFDPVSVLIVLRLNGFPRFSPHVILDLWWDLIMFPLLGTCTPVLFRLLESEVLVDSGQ